jgi:hypothetical protein
MYGLWAWLRRPDAGTALLGGLALGYAATVRHSNLALALVVAVAVAGRIASDGRRRAWPPFSILVLLAAYAVFPVLLGLYNLHCFGSFFASGYGLSEEQRAFKWDYFPLHSSYLNQGLSFDVAYLLFPLGLLGMALEGPWTERLMRWAWLVPLYLIYTTYYFACTSQAYFRFILETLPLLVGAAFVLIRRLAAGRRAWFGLTALVVALIAVNNLGFLKGVWRGGPLYPSAGPLAEIGRVLDATAAPDAVVFLSPRAKFAIGTHRQYRSYGLDAFSAGYGRGSFQPYRYHPFHPQCMQQAARRARLEAFYRDQTDEQLRQRKRDLVRESLARGREVVFLLPTHEAAQQRRELGDAVVLEARKEWTAGWWGRWGIYAAKPVLLPAEGPAPTAVPAP